MNGGSDRPATIGRLWCSRYVAPAPLVEHITSAPPTQRKLQSSHLRRQLVSAVNAAPAPMNDNVAPALAIEYMI